MTPGFHNPYASRATTQQKRTNRPWDASGSPSRKNEHVVRTEASTVNYVQQNNDSDPFDCDIDWDAASLLIDAVESKNAARGSNSTEPCRHQATKIARPSKTDYVSVPLASPQHAQNKLPTEQRFSSASSGCGIVDDSNSSKIPLDRPRTVSTTTSHPQVFLDAKLPAMEVEQFSNRHEDSNDFSNQLDTKRQKLCDRDTLTTLRPESWKNAPAQTTSHHLSLIPQNGNSSSVAALSSASTEQHEVDPRQVSLPPQLRFDPKSTAPVEDSYRSTLVANASLSVPLLNGWNLFPHQRKAILCGILMRRMILALDMGLGKTLIGCVWTKSFVRTMEGTKVVVVCPVSLKKEWKRTAEDATGLSVSDGDSENDFVNSDVIIVSWAKVPAKLNASKFVVVADEAHTMQSMQAARTKNALQLMDSPSCVGVLLLTGTPMKNGKPSNLFPLLKAVRHPLGRNQRMYETHFCAGKEIRLGNGPVIWSATGSSNVPQLRELSQSHLLHLSKEACLKELPPQTRIVKKVPVSSRMQAQHDRALNELAKVYKNNCESRSSAGNDAVLGATQKLRMVSSLAKIDAAIELALAVLNQEAAIVVFTSFVEVAKTVHKKLMESGWNAELLTGETPAKKRQDMVDNFQKGLSPVFVSTFGAGGVGLTLTAACTVVLIDRPWTPGEANQAEDRVRRIGQTRPVKSIWISAFDLDEKIDALLASKSQTANEVLTGNASQSSYQQGSIIPLILNTVLAPSYT